MSESITRQVVEDWVRRTTGIFTYKDMFFEIPVNDSDNRQKAYVYMSRICKDKIAKPIDGRHGAFRLIDRDAPVLNWKGVEDIGGIDITWPFGLEKYVKVFPRNIVLVGKVWNAGGSAFAYNIINLNWRKHRVVLFDSENSEQELRLRFSKFPDYESWPDDFVRERTKNFADVIEPDSINIIDHLEIIENAYLVGRYIREIHDALGKGIAIVNVQKAQGALLPVGRDFGLRLPRFVINIDKGLLTIVKAKTWVDRTINPDNMKFSFSLIEGTKFVNIKRSY